MSLTGLVRRSRAGVERRPPAVFVDEQSVTPTDYDYHGQ
jgi:hypothetical protein